MSKPCPSLSASGWKQSVGEKGDAIMANYITSDYSQTHIYAGKVTSLAYHIQQYGNNPTQLEEIVRSDLIKYFNRYFDMVEVDVTTDIPDTDDPDRLNLRINVNVSQDGKKYNIGKEIMSVNDKVVKVFDLNNEGIVNEF